MTPTQQIESLERELQRLDAMLADDESFAALQQIERRAAIGDLAPGDAAAIIGGLEAALSDNAVYQARRKIAEAITLLRSPATAEGHSPALTRRPADASAARPPRMSLADRIAMIEPMQRGEVFRTRVSLKPQDGAVDPSTHTPPPATEPEPVPTPCNPLSIVTTPESATYPAPSVPADDLTFIRGIDSQTARRLAASNSSTFAAIAAWRKADVTATASELGLGKRISRECWIEQAAILASGGSTAYSRSCTGLDVVVPTSPDSVPCVPAAVPVAVPPDVPDEISTTAKAAANSPAPANPASPVSAAPLPSADGSARQTMAESAAVASQHPQTSARTLAMFERSQWLVGPRSLQAAVMAAEAAVQQRATHRPTASASRPPASTPVTDKTAPARPENSAPPAAQNAPDVPSQPGGAEIGGMPPPAPEGPPPPPTPYRPPVTEFGRSPHNEVDLGEIVRSLRRSSDHGASEPALRIVEDFEDDPLDLHGEEAKVEILTHGPQPKFETRPAVETPRLLPVRPKLAPGSPPRVEVQDGDVHVAYRGIVMEASVDIVHFDEEGRRIPKATPE